MQLSRAQLVEDTVFILQCLRQNAKGGRQNALADVRTTLEGSIALDLEAYVGFLKRFGYVEMDEKAIQVTAQGERAARGDEDVSTAVQDHFRQMIEGDTRPAIAAVEGELGRGPLSRVRAARFGELGLPVALKEFEPVWESLPWLSQAELSRRVRREAQAQAQLGHPCVLPILEVRGRAGADCADVQIVMPLAASTLRDKLSRSERLPSWQAVRVAAQVSYALAHAHAQGLVHGAVKPENVLLSSAGNVLLTDFGAARLVALSASGGPRVVVELGDARYRAPEVSAAEPAGPAADAFALGALLHELLAGSSGGALPADLPAALVELMDELRHCEPEKRPPLSAAAARLARQLGTHPLFTL